MFRSYVPMMHRKLSAAAVLSLVALSAGLVATIAPAHAQNNDAAQPQVVQPVQNVPKPGTPPKKVAAQLAAIKKFIKQLSPEDRKINGSLLFADTSAAMRASMPPNVPKPQDHFTKDTQGRIRVDIRGTVSTTLLKAITDLGGRVVYASPSKLPAYAYPITAYLPPNAMRTLAKRSDVKRIRPAAMPMTDSAAAPKALVPLNRANHAAFTGSVDTEGDRAHGSDWVRYYYGATGFGVKVGVLSDSVFHLADSQKSKDLDYVQVLEDDPFGAGEGTAMLEIIHDLAPNADLAFATADGGEASYADNIRALFSVGCRVIVDDVWYYTEPAFQDGVIAQAVNDVTQAGAIYFASSGNRGNLKNGTSQAWEGDFNDSGVDLIVNDISPTDPIGRIHQFDGDLFNQVNGGSYVFLQWSDPMGNSANDYDLIVLDPDDNLYDYSANFQTGDGDDPVEGPVVAFPGFKIYVVQYAGDARYLRLFALNNSLVHQTNGVSFTHAAGPSAMGVAATPASPPGPNTGPFQWYDLVEEFSSDGPRIHFFNPDGSDITPGNYLKSTGGGVVIAKPNVTAADGVKTSFTAPSPFNPFYGTSAAAPHAAAVAAQIKSYRPGITPTGMKAVIANSCLDIEDDGFDYTSGNGILMARLAMDFIDKFINPRSIKITSLTDRTVTLYWETNMPSDSHVFYYDANTAYPIVGDNTIVTAGPPYPHTVTITGLRPSTRYWASVRSANGDYGLSTAADAVSFVTKPVITPPGTPAANIFVGGFSVARTAQNRLIATITIANTGGTTATNVQITGVTLGGVNPLTTLPVKVPTVPAYGIAKVIVSFASQPKGSATATVSGKAGTTDLPPFSKTVTIP